MIFDSHIHTKFSTDSNMNIENAISTAKSKNIGLIITDHMDLDFPAEKDFKFDVNEFFNTYENYRSNNLKLGIELGLSENFLDQNTKISTSFDFDFILGSIHSINGKDIYYELLNNAPSKKEFFIEYFNTMLNCVKLYDSFDSLSHIDYPSRYCSFDNKEIVLNDNKDTISEIFKTIISKGKVIELNTNRLNSKEAINTIMEIYKLYHDLGGRYVTIGSDSHIKENIGKNFDMAFDIINALNLKAVYYNKRKIEYMK